jgi:hypothetical protein
MEPEKGKKYPMCLTYLDGIISSAVAYDTTATFKDAGNEGFPAILTADSTNGTIDIYGIRFYSTALTDSTILNNYTASLPTLAQREEKYNSNLVFDPVSGEISLSKIMAGTYNLTIPYAIITGGLSCDKKFKLDKESE